MCKLKYSIRFDSNKIDLNVELLHCIFLGLRKLFKLSFETLNEKIHPQLLTVY